mmetsp:Transcript_69595/g.203689  ORF Transcript_69595/g.203689 Transcript_69595/m.203689 type:complete len:350 (+) Transcript_69595:709-1758(+)
MAFNASTFRPFSGSSSIVVRASTARPLFRGLVLARLFSAALLAWRRPCLRRATASTMVRLSLLGTSFVMTIKASCFTEESLSSSRALVADIALSTPSKFRRVSAFSAVSLTSCCLWASGSLRRSTTSGPVATRGSTSKACCLTFLLPSARLRAAAAMAPWLPPGAAICASTWSAVHRTSGCWSFVRSAAVAIARSSPRAATSASDCSAAALTSGSPSRSSSPTAETAPRLPLGASWAKDCTASCLTRLLSSPRRLRASSSVATSITETTAPGSSHSWASTSLSPTALEPTSNLWHMAGTWKCSAALSFTSRTVLELESSRSRTFPATFLTRTWRAMPRPKPPPRGLDRS